MKLTKRGKRVRAVLILIGLSLFIYAVCKISGHLWWTEDGYCWGEFDVCYKF